MTCSFIRLFHTGFPKFSGLFPLYPPHCVKRSHKQWSLNARIHPQVSQGPCTLSLGVGEAEVGCCRFEMAHTCMMCLYWDISLELGHCLDANLSAMCWCLGKAEDIALGHVCSLTGLKASMIW